MTCINIYKSKTCIHILTMHIETVCYGDDDTYMKPVDALLRSELSCDRFEQTQSMMIMMMAVVSKFENVMKLLLLLRMMIVAIVALLLIMVVLMMVMLNAAISSV